MGKTPTVQQPMWPWTPKKMAGGTTPSIHGILKSGDSHEYSSSLFTQLSDSFNEPTWRPLFDAFSDTTARKPFSQFAYSNSFQKSAFGSRRRRKSRLVESADMSAEKHTSFPRKRSRSRDLNISFRPLRRFATVALDEIPAGNPSDDIRDIVLLDGQPCIPLNPEELVALSFALGVPLIMEPLVSPSDKTTPAIKGSGAFGISLHSETSSNKTHLLRLRYKRAPVIQQPAPGGSYSILFAKHMACGSLPFASDHHTTHALHIDAGALAALKTGQSTIGPPTALSTRQTIYLSRLPASSPVSFHSLDPLPTPLRRQIPQRSKSGSTNSNTTTTSNTPTSSPRRSWSTRRQADFPSTRRLSWPALSRTTPSSPTSLTPLPLTFSALLSSLPFTGGLPPFASLPLLTATRFTASAGRAPGNLLPLLENLIHKIHHHAPAVDFGPYLSPQYQAKWLRTAGYVEYAPNIEATDVGTGVGRVSRYVAAVSALVGMLKGAEGGVDAAEREKEVEEACRAEMEGAYWEAVASVGRDEKGERGKETLGGVLAEVLKKPLPFDVATIATVARLVVAAWTWQVGVVMWSEAEKQQAKQWKGEQGVYEVVELESFPATMVLA